VTIPVKDTFPIPIASFSRVLNCYAVVELRVAFRVAFNLVAMTADNDGRHSKKNLVASIQPTVDDP